ncbi:hypothetical protein [Jannaschia aquimarina]|uniref:Uncharacterized protein n=1 Tax=Jannaschia aquimarina TaxID=935700 RepID=A0A0D1D994_9RHOB|nr:hypothetical protein [Jannaschia aquimarina]KIT16468.1 hypothetical protein jaqu_16960 [Jannaschia aquimarina]SNT07848.1 hypothetical protein SAMN05421775_105150 [Jannaschia aquimarina]
MSLKEDLVRDHVGLAENRQARRYFAKFETILSHLPAVAEEMRDRRRLDMAETEIVSAHLTRLAGTFRALSHKYLMTGRDTGVFLGSLTVDRSASGFPVLQELLSMAADARNAGAHLSRLPSAEDLKEAMIARIVGERRIPSDLQYALSQRLYHQALAGDLFLARNEVDLIPLAGTGQEFIAHWSVWDGRRNLPVIWMMRFRDSGRTTLDQDSVRLERVSAHLMAQALPELKLVTVAQGVDDDFEGVHPISLKRLTVGPMYSSAYTRQTEGLGPVLDRARPPVGQDWALAWALEELEAERTETERTGWFSTRERTIFRLIGPEAAETGATRTERAAILPEPVFQTFAESRAPGFDGVEIYVAGKGRLWRAG